VQLEMLEETWLRHPYYWASFVPIGAWGAISGPASRPAGSSSIQEGEVTAVPPGEPRLLVPHPTVSSRPARCRA
jgi:hypothetical protein